MFLSMHFEVYRRCPDVYPLCPCLWTPWATYFIRNAVLNCLSLYPFNWHKVWWTVLYEVFVLNFILIVSAKTFWRSVKFWPTYSRFYLARFWDIVWYQSKREGLDRFVAIHASDGLTVLFLSWKWPVSAPETYGLLCIATEQREAAGDLLDCWKTIILHW